MTSVTDFNHYECPKIDARQVDAFFDLRLDTEDPTKLLFDSSWGALDPVDLTPAVKAAETITHLMLDPVDVPEYLRFDNEAGDSECIHGDDLSRIISMKYLKDVDQETRPVDGDIYVYDGDDNLFHTYAFIAFVNNVLQRLGDLEQRMSAAEQAITNMGNRITAIENAIYDWNNDKISKIPRGTLNIYGDASNSGSHADGIFSHDPNIDEVNDLYFA